MTKICTDLKQSKNLLKLGLDPKTADMVILHKEPYETPDSKFDGLHEVLCITYSKYDTNSYKKYKNIPYFPAWSLSALLELIPDEIGPSFTSVYMVKDKGYEIGYKDGYTSPLIHKEISDLFVDTAFNMLVWLLENNYLKSNQ